MAKPVVVTTVPKDVQFISLGDEHGGGASLHLLNDQRIEELLQALRRATNTWENPPAWIVDILDKMDGTPSPAGRAS